jgi:hypothetical protein
MWSDNCRKSDGAVKGGKAGKGERGREVEGRGEGSTNWEVFTVVQTTYDASSNEKKSHQHHIIDDICFRVTEVFKDVCQNGHETAIPI